MFKACCFFVLLSLLWQTLTCLFIPGSGCGVQTPIRYVENLSKMPVDATCVVVGKIDDTIARQWTQWSHWSPCFDEFQSRTRSCPSLSTTYTLPCQGKDLEIAKACSCTEMETEFAGNTLETLPAIASAQDCQVKCQHRSQCHFYTFDPTTYNCHIKSADSGRTIKAAMISGRKFCHKNCFEFDIDYWGNDMFIYNDIASPIDCLERCKTHHGCVGITFLAELFHDQASRNKCFLKSQMSNRVGFSDAISSHLECL